MVKHGWLLLIVGGLLSVPVGLDLPVPRAAATAISLAVALGPLLILVGYDAIADRSGGGAARSGLQVAGLGLLILSGTEIATVVLPYTHDTRGSEHVATAATIAFTLIALGSLVASLVLFRRWLGIALPLLVGVGALAVILAPITAGAQPAFGVWALSCALLGVALKWTR